MPDQIFNYETMQQALRLTRFSAVLLAAAVPAALQLLAVPQLASQDPRSSTSASRMKSYYQHCLILWDRTHAPTCKFLLDPHFLLHSGDRQQLRLTADTPDTLFFMYHSEQAPRGDGTPKHGASYQRNILHRTFSQHCWKCSGLLISRFIFSTLAFFDLKDVRCI